MNYFSSDFHLGHKVIVPKYRTFASQEEHDSIILEQMSYLGKRDILFILGDFIFDSDTDRYQFYMDNINKMACRIKLVFGNHDSLRLLKEDKIEVQLPLFSYKNIWLSHCPIHPKELRDRLGNIHGHLHGTEIPDPRYFNVCLDNNDFKFVEADKIIETLKGINNGIQTI